VPDLLRVVSMDHYKTQRISLLLFLSQHHLVIFFKQVRIHLRNQLAFFALSNSNSLSEQNISHPSLFFVFPFRPQLFGNAVELSEAEQMDNPHGMVFIILFRFRSEFYRHYFQPKNTIRNLYVHFFFAFSYRRLIHRVFIPAKKGSYLLYSYRKFIRRHWKYFGIDIHLS
jgi:hypothetical protein